MTAPKLPADPFMLTHSGRIVNVWDPDPNTIVREDLEHHLARTGRFSGAGRCFLSVAQHSVHVSLLCPPKCARYALIHDAEEAYLNDWPSPVKSVLRRLGGQAFADWIARWKAALGVAFGVEIEDVKPWDLQSMLAERRDNGPYGLSDNLWLGAGGYADCPRPHPMVVVPLPPDQAERLYHARWNQVFKK